MATSSIQRNIKPKRKTEARNLVIALENAQRKVSKSVTLKKKCSDMSAEEIRKIFGGS